MASGVIVINIIITKCVWLIASIIIDSRIHVTRYPVNAEYFELKTLSSLLTDERKVFEFDMGASTLSLERTLLTC